MVRCNPRSSNGIATLPFLSLMFLNFFKQGMSLEILALYRAFLKILWVGRERIALVNLRFSLVRTQNLGKWG